MNSIICPICNRKICDTQSNAALILDNHIERCIRRNQSGNSYINYNETDETIHSNSNDNHENKLLVSTKNTNDDYPVVVNKFRKEHIIKKKKLLGDLQLSCANDEYEELFSDDDDNVNDNESNWSIDSRASIPAGKTIKRNRLSNTRNKLDMLQMNRFNKTNDTTDRSSNSIQYMSNKQLRSRITKSIHNTNNNTSNNNDDNNNSDDNNGGSNEKGWMKKNLSSLQQHLEITNQPKHTRNHRKQSSEDALFEQSNGNYDNDNDHEHVTKAKAAEPYLRVLSNESMLIQDDWEEHCYRDRLEILYSKYGTQLNDIHNSDNEIIYKQPLESSSECDNLLQQDDEAVACCYETIFTYKFPCILTKFHTKVFLPTWQTLHNYQREGCEWLYTLYEQGVGGILGDEMGLGKTAQVCSHFGSLAMQQHDSNHINTTNTTSSNNTTVVVQRTVNRTQTTGKGIFIIVCPATVLHHWLQEMHQWAPFVRTVVLHSASSTASELIKLGNEGIIRVLYKLMKKHSSKHGLAVITTYEGLRRYRSALISIAWTAVCLDEGQKIRNPMTEITSTCKMLPAFHRIILSGTPIQNSLRELWSLFDFIYPGRLGSLPVFETEFVTPIRIGGYANAHKLSYEIALRCAMTLQQTVKPHLLRRKKDDLISITKLPPKTEQVLFCQISNKQKELYMNVLASSEVKAIIERRMIAFRAINVLRQLCNHPALVQLDGKIQQLLDYNQQQYKKQKQQYQIDKDIDIDSLNDDENENDMEDYQGLLSKLESGGIVWADSGKLLVLSKLLPLWFAEGHKVLIFSQTRGMLSIIESMIREFRFHYLRLDGNTPVSKRAGIVQKFNNDRMIFVMLLTTRTGGVGISLTSANRVVLFDPDWNPMTDIQSRERAWRLGQTREVTIYRLISKGTIEEKIYQRQIFKVLLSNRILENAKQKSFFSQNQIKDLFELQGYDNNNDSDAYICSYPGSKARLDSLPKEGEVDLLFDNKIEEHYLPSNNNDLDVGISYNQPVQFDSYITSTNIRQQLQLHQEINYSISDHTFKSSGYNNSTAVCDSINLSQLGVYMEEYIEPTIALQQQQQQIEEDAEEPSSIDGSNSRDRKLLQALFAGEAITSVYDHDYLLAPSTNTTSINTTNTTNNRNNTSITNTNRNNNTNNNSTSNVKAKLSNTTTVAVVVNKEERVLLKAKADQIMKQALQKLMTSATTYNGACTAHNNSNITTAITTNNNTAITTNNTNTTTTTTNAAMFHSNTSNNNELVPVVVIQAHNNYSNNPNTTRTTIPQARFGSVSATGNATLSSSSKWLSSTNNTHTNSSNNSTTRSNNNNSLNAVNRNNHIVSTTTITTTIPTTISLSIRQNITDRLHNMFNKTKNPISTTFILHRFKDLGDHYAPLFKEILKSIAIHNNGTWIRRTDN